MTLVLRPEKRSKVTRKTQSHSTSCLKIPFHPYQPTFGHDDVFFFFLFIFYFFIFFFLNRVRCSTPTPQTIEI